MYCLDLEQNINFDLDKIAPCCPALLYTQYQPPSIPFTGGEFPVEEFKQMREQVKRDIENGTSNCLKCVMLVKDKPVPTDYLIHSITINNFKYCNARCSYCNFWKDDQIKIKYHLYPIFKWIFDNHMMDPNGFVVWGGGEPTIYSEFSLLLSLFKFHNVKSIINSNCIMFSKPLYYALEEGYATLQLSLDCGCRETYIKMKGLDKFDDVINNLKLYRVASPKGVTLKYIMNDKNNSREEIIKFLDLAKNSHIYKVNLSSEAYESANEKISEETFKGVEIFLREAKKRAIEVTIFKNLFGQIYYNRLDKIYLSVFPKHLKLFNKLFYIIARIYYK